jgi:hypothetical protein
LYVFIAPLHPVIANGEVTERWLIISAFVTQRLYGGHDRPRGWLCVLTWPTDSSSSGGHRAPTDELAEFAALACGLLEPTAAWSTGTRRGESKQWLS